MKKLFAGLAIVGTILPYSQFLPWVMENGFRVDDFISNALDNRISMFAWSDVLISAITLIIIINKLKQILTLKEYALLIAGTLLIGVSFGLPYLAFCLSGKNLFTASKS